MKRVSSILVGLLLAAAGALAQAPTTPAPSATPLPFPRPSWFDGSKLARDPFAKLNAAALSVPKSVVVTAAKTSASKEAGLAGLFQVSTIALGRYSLAVINGEVFSVGEVFHVRHGSKLADVKVLNIMDGAVELGCENTTFKVALVVQKPKSLNEPDK